MKYFELDKQEQNLLDLYEKGRLKSVKNKVKELTRLRGYTRASLGRSRNINIRLSERDLLKLKSRAVAVGIPYQTFVSSILHQFGNR